MSLGSVAFQESLADIRRPLPNPPPQAGEEIKRRRSIVQLTANEELASSYPPPRAGEGREGTRGNLHPCFL
jgi:hypothetical protein